MADVTGAGPAEPDPPAVSVGADLLPGIPATGSAADPAEPGPPPRRRRWPRVLTAVLSVLVLLVAAAGAAGALVYQHLGSNITALDISDQVGTDRPIRPVIDDGGNYSAVNILLMGSDSRQGADNRGYGNADVITGQRSDTTILLHLSADRSRALAVSIPRDTWITLPECKDRQTGETVGGYENKFNVAFELGGPGCTVKAVEQLTGVTVDHFMVVDFGGFKRVIDAMDGVEVCLTKAVDDDKSGLVLPAGVSVVRGEQALAFVRARKTLGDGSDLSRIKRQQQFLSSLIRKASSTELLLNPVSLYQVLDAATKSLTADPQLADIDNLRDLAFSVRGMKPSQISFVTLPWLARGDGANVVVDTERMAPIVEAIDADTPWPPKKPGGQPRLTKAPEQITIRVLNGSGTPGLAKRAAAALAEQGFQVVEVANADTQDYASSVVRHDPGWDESAKTVTWAVRGATSEPEDGLGSVLTVIVGADYDGVRPVVVSSGTGTDSQATTADEVTCSS